MADYIERADLVGNKLTTSEMQRAVREMDGSQVYLAFLEVINAQPAVPLVFCRECAHHGRCAAEAIYLSEGIAEPFCCRGEPKEGDGK